MTRVYVAIGASLALILVSLLVLVTGGGPAEISLRQADDNGGFYDTLVTSTTTTPPSTEAPSTLPPPPPSTAPTGTSSTAVPGKGVVPRTTAPPTDCRVPQSASIDLPAGLRPYAGLGTWVDVYDWSMTYSSGAPPVGLADIDRMARLGVQTVYLQTSRFNSPDAVLEKDRLLSLVDRAHDNGMAVVGWYLPTHENPQADLDRLLAAAALPIEGIAVDIESSAVRDLATRSREAVALSKALREALPGRVIGAIPIPPVINTFKSNYWPNFPWADLAPYYDVWMPMAYWTDRAKQPEYLDAYRYMADNIDLLREWIGRPNAVVSPVGGIGDKSSCVDIARMVHALNERGAIGGSIYDYRTTNDESWAALRAIRR